MILKLARIDSLGIFKDYRASTDLNDFTKYNLIYGSNGSGKSTLSRLFRMLSTDNEVVPDPEVKFDVRFSSGASADEDDPKGHGRNLLIYDEEFVKVNIDWDNQVKSILLVSDAKIKEKKEYDQKSGELKKKKDEITELRRREDAISQNIARFLSSTAKKIKTGMRTIATSDRKYLNYNKIRLEIHIRTIVLSNLSSLVLSDDSVDRLLQAATAELRAELSFPREFQQSELLDVSEGLQELLGIEIIGKTIKRLKENPDIAGWVKQGMELVTKHKSTVCEFCGQPIPAELFQNLSAHFSDEVESHITDMKKLAATIKDLIPSTGIYPLPLEMYPELQGEYMNELEKLGLTYGKLKNWMEAQLQQLEIKIRNPFQPLQIRELDEALLSSMAFSRADIEDLIKKHNRKTKSFQESISRDKSKLESHFAATDMLSFGYQRKETDRNNLSSLIEKERKTQRSIEQRVKELEKSLSSESLGASKFNDKLHKFLGHGEISLSFSSSIGGYRILRRGQKGHATKLSEGERNALAFVYFATKAREKGNDISDSILIIDDPVSSFDSKNIFHACSFLRAEFSEAKQLVILTHNFLFFRLVRDWIMKKNKSGQNSIANCYQISVDLGQERKSSIRNAHRTLKKYNTEYHFLFSELYGISQKQDMTLSETFLAANLSRKLLETFLNFKMPKGRHDCRQLLESAIKDQSKLERVYRFINTYSHYTPMGASDGAIDSLFGETPDVVKDVLGVIRDHDEEHYKELVEIA